MNMLAMLELLLYCMFANKILFASPITTRMTKREPPVITMPIVMIFNVHKILQ